MTLVPVPFPACTICGDKSQKSYHKDCGGELLIDPYTDYIHCERCYGSWLIWETKYNCSKCGNVFSAKDIHKEIEKMLRDCERVIGILETRSKTREDIHKIGKVSFHTFLESFVKKLGEIAGYVVEIIVRLLFPH